jgi:hypothetical protein
MDIVQCQESLQAFRIVRPQNPLGVFVIIPLTWTLREQYPVANSGPGNWPCRTPFGRPLLMGPEATYVGPELP